MTTHKWKDIKQNLSKERQEKIDAQVKEELHQVDYQKGWADAIQWTIKHKDILAQDDLCFEAESQDALFNALSEYEKSFK